MIIVNLTTIHSRLNVCAATIWSLINQEKKPDKIVLWISDEPYLADTGLSEKPEFVNLLNKVADLIEVRYTENTGPYRKIIPALRIAKDEDILIYADDDVVYSEQWLKKLIEKYYQYQARYPIASRVRKVKNNIFGFQQGYFSYPIITDDVILNDKFIITGIGGCVLQKKHISKEYIFNNDYLTIAPKTDDLWISKILQLSHSPILTCPDALSDIQEINNNYESLSQSNVFITSSSSRMIKLLMRIKVKMYSYFGIPCCNNDLALKKINNYFLNAKK
ncbi:TPA: glycosyltransferase [Providencia rettgeri]|uniref:glycosyltransferase n=1 Tax=Providencia sp. VP23HZSY-1 TaxID=3391806 RepID=UPI0024AC0F6D|nr:glycosyltransferase [Providencia rettgeri]ELQ1457761.1 glycosyltransferase [Providencia rettgeri]ELR5187728.1 glycosyltransferase [Providencia rettgeri]EMB0752234.1 glycosyltransferase [Providencia rettgeri]HEM7509413.1 glycosyltransferase [Providencia rettgeri]